MGDTVRTSKSGYDLLADPILNKGMAFSNDERDRFGLHGLIPPHVGTLDIQVRRRLAASRRAPAGLPRYSFLRELQDTNETLFYALLTGHLAEMLPVVYTPTVGLGCQHFSEVYRKPRGLFLGPPHADMLDRILDRILGLGDQGAGGMGIPIGKLALYTGCGGIHPREMLPILLDTGTDNEDLIEDPLYIGWRHARVRGAEYDAFIRVFVDAVRRRFPHVLLQWEDFAGTNAARLLATYRAELCTFNDDIQGTAAVVTGTLLAAVSAAEQRLADQRVVLVGAGSAGIGICRLIREAMLDEGLSPDEATSRFFLVDRDGLLVDGAHGLTDEQRFFAHPASEAEGDLVAVVATAKPTVLIGVTGKPNLFSEGVIRAMAEHAKRPMVFPLSNPTARRGRARRHHALDGGARHHRDRQLVSARDGGRPHIGDQPSQNPTFSRSGPRRHRVKSDAHHRHNVPARLSRARRPLARA